MREKKVYKKTYRGVMYSAGFGTTLIALTMITARNIVEPRRSRLRICKLKISLNAAYSHTKAPRG